MFVFTGDSLQMYIMKTASISNLLRDGGWEEKKEWKTEVLCLFYNYFVTGCIAYL